MPPGPPGGAGRTSVFPPDIISSILKIIDADPTVAHAKNLQEEDKLVKAGFEFIRFREQDNVAIYRRRKQHVRR